MEIKEEKGYRIADIKAVSGTILLDQKKSNRVFQKKVQTYMGIASTVTADTEHSACILPGSDMRTGGTLIQYQETDWRFLKRMASQLGLPLVPDTSYYYPRFCLGLPEGEKRELGEIISCDLCFDGRYYAVSGKCLVDGELLLGAPWGTYSRRLIDSSYRIKKPIIGTYEDLEEILKITFKMYEDFKNVLTGN